LDVIEEMDFWSIPAINFATYVSRKQFNWWEKIWSKINGFIWYTNTIQQHCVSSCDYRNGAMFCFISPRLTWANGCTAYVKKCPRTTYIKLWLIQEDWTKKVIAQKDIESWYYKCLYFEDGSLKWDLVWHTCCYWKINLWKLTTTPQTACQGDRVYIEYGLCEDCLLYDVYTSTKTNSSCSQCYWEIVPETWSCSADCKAGDKVMFTWTNQYICSCITPCSARNYATSDSCRFNWIQFSIE